MPGEPIRERIAAAYRTALGPSAGLQVGTALVGTVVLPAAHYGVRNAYRVSLPAMGVACPFRIVVPGPEKVTGKVRDLNACEMRLAVTGTHRLPFGEEPNPDTVANRLAADIQAVMESASLLAALGAVPGWVTHREENMTPLLAWPSEPLVSCEVVYIVSYRRNRTDPAEGIP